MKSWFMLTWFEECECHVNSVRSESVASEQELNSCFKLSSQKENLIKENKNLSKNWAITQNYYKNAVEILKQYVYIYTCA